MSQARPGRGRVSDYMISAVGIVPLLLGSPSPTRLVESPSPSGTQVYRQDLLGAVDAHLVEIRDLIEFLTPGPELADLLFIEDPDHAPYSSAYSLEPIELALLEALPRRQAYDEAPEVWL